MSGQFQRSALLRRAEPHLTALKLVVLAVEDVDYDMGRQLGSARFNLFKSIQRGNLEEASGWLNTLTVAVEFLRKEHPQAMKSVDVAVAKLQEILSAKEEVNK